MADTPEYLEQARANLALAEQLMRAGSWPELQWSCVAAFYVAIHCIKASSVDGRVFKQPPRRLRGHAADQQWMADNARQFYIAYRELRELSMLCRYELYHPSRLDLEVAYGGAAAILAAAESDGGLAGAP